MTSSNGNNDKKSIKEVKPKYTLALIAAPKYFPPTFIQSAVFAITTSRKRSE